MKFLVFSSFRELWCASHCGILDSDGGPWRTICNFSTFSSKIFLWREREWYELDCDRTSSVQVWVEYRTVNSHYYRVSASAVFHLYPGDWGIIFLPNIYTYLPDCVVSLPRRTLYDLLQDVTISIRVKSISHLLSTSNLCQRCCCIFIMGWVLGLILHYLITLF